MAFIRRKTAKEIQTARPPLRLVPPLESAQLPPYSGERGTCEKCGSSGAGTAYYDPRRSCTHYNGPGALVRWGQERMHRSCRTCGYAWDEQLPIQGEEER